MNTLMADRFPLTNLEHWIDAHPHRGSRWETTPLTAREQIADRLGVSIAAVKQLAVRGLSVAGADRAAIACGAHPALVWPNWAEVTTPEHCRCGANARPTTGRWPICDRCGAPLSRLRTKHVTLHADTGP